MEDFELLASGMRILQTDELFRLGTDSIVLSDFCQPLRGTEVADLGCGGGALGVLLCASNDRIRVTGIELQERACEIAERNIALNGLQPRLRALRGDLRQIRELLPANGFDAVVSNPPYFPVGRGDAPADEALAIARTERCCPLDALCDAAVWLLRSSGSFHLVYRAERLAELMYALKSRRLEPKRLRVVRHHAGARASVVLVESRLDGKPSLFVEPELLLYTESGELSPEYRRIYHMDGESGRCP